MKNFLFILLAIFMTLLSTSAQTPRSTDLQTTAQTPTISEANYRIFDKQGNPATVEQIVDSLKNVDVVFLGEQHDDAVAHFLQTEIFRKASEKYKNERSLALSLEMFERDVQPVVNEYLQDLITETHFLQSSRPWGNYATDYRPAIEFAKAAKIPVIAANAPRRYVNMVSRKGRDSLNALSPEAKNWLAPLPYGTASDAYAKKFNALPGMTDAATPQMHSPMLNSQSLWDATMAFSIAENLKRMKNPLIVHFNGSFHTENRLGTPEHLLNYDKKARFLVVTMRYEEDFTNFNKSKLENLGDFIVLTDAKIPRSKR